MQAFTTFEGRVLPLDRANVDTDAIIPKQFLKSVKRTGFGPNLFDEWRYLDHGEPGMDNKNRPVNPEFIKGSVFCLQGRISAAVLPGSMRPGRFSIMVSAVFWLQAMPIFFIIIALRMVYYLLF